MIESLEQLRKDVDICTQIADGEDEFDTVWIVKSAFLNDLDAIEREVKKRYIEGPIDKNGELVCLGDVLQGERSDGGWCEPFEVHSLRIGPDGWVALEKCGLVHIVKLCRHKQPTVEDILMAFANHVRNEAMKFEQISDETIAEYAAKLQLKEAEQY